ncbi:MAG: hypothetical protein LCH81_11165 [Bacteroidetes bacterium]|nr:hypothetical protein [Bacteroidota bacterium]
MLRNFLLLLSFLALLLFVRSRMQHWMESKQVVAFEFLKTEAAAQSLLSAPEWQTGASDGLSDRLRQNTYWDFLFIVAYTGVLFFLARVMLGDTHRFMPAIARLLLIAGLADAVENACILQILNGARGWFPASMSSLAAIKFAMLLLAVGVMVAGLLKKR